jgi:ABC-type Fe3+-hydroxamate transport system substrate-binding protein
VSAGKPRIDWVGVEHPPAQVEPRIASWVPSLTELLFALGLGGRVVARTGFCIHPRDAVRRVVKTGGTKDPDLAALRALAPTHLVVNVDENRRECVDAAREFVPNVIVTHPMDPADNPRLYALLGAIFDREREAVRLADAFDMALAALERTAAGLPRERVLYLIWKKPWMSVARDTYVSRTLSRAGMDTLPAEAARRYPAIDDGDPVWNDADRILLSTEPYAFRPRDVAALQRSCAKPVALIDGEWTSWYGVRAIESMRALAAFRRGTLTPWPAGHGDALRNPH